MKAANAPVLPLFDQAPRRVDAVSREHFARIRPTLTAREIEVFLLVCDYLEAHSYANVSGGELAAWSGRDKTLLRPRLTGLTDKGWLVRCGEVRASRVADEGRCRGYAHAVPRAAVERGR